MRRTALHTSLFLLPLLAFAAACGDDDESSATTAAAETTEAAEPEVVLRYEAIGGCQMMGPNCPTYEVYDDGTVTIARTGENQPPEITGSIPADEILAFLDGAASIDFVALADRVGPGTCQSCVDGVDTMITMELPSGEVTLDSTVVNFDPAEPFFADLETLMTDVRAVGELSLVQR